MLRATEDVENAIVAVTELESEDALLAKEVDAHLQARDAAQDAYRGGAVSLVEVLDEDRQLLAAQDSLARVRTDDARSAVAAFRALGGGWTVPAPVGTHPPYDDGHLAAAARLPPPFARQSIQPGDADAIRQ